MPGGQARDRRLLGLIEALRVVPLRNPAEDTAWSAAAENAAPQPETAASEAAAPPLNARSSAKAIWALAMLGGPVLFQLEMEAALNVRPPTAGSASAWWWALGAAVMSETDSSVHEHVN